MRSASIPVPQASSGFSATTRTGPGGTFSLTGAPSGTVSLRADTGDLTTGLRSATTQVTIADGQTQIAAEIDFPPGFRLSGRVTRLGSPVGGAIVGAASPAATGNLAARTDDNGGYQLDGLLQGTYSLSVNVPNGSTVRRSVDVSEDTTYDVEVPASRVAGTVVEAGTQKPLSDAAVQLQGVRRGPGLVSTDGSGHFAIEDLDPQSYHMTVTKPAYQTDNRDVTASDDSELHIELKPGDGIQLVVHDGIYGMALSNVMVRVGDPTGLTVFAGGVSLDSDGLGVIPSLKPGTYQVRVSSGGYATTTLPSVAVPAPPLQVSLTPGGTLLIQVGPTTLALNTSGQLIAAGLPVGAQGGQRVRLASPSQEVDHVAPGHYTLAVDGGVSRDFDVREGAATTVALP